MIVCNFPSIPDRTGYILNPKEENPYPELLRTGRALARQGASCIAIPCVTAHYFYDALQAALPVPVIHGVKETVLHLKENGVTAAGIMATDGTIATGLFSRALESAGIACVLPSRQRQADVTHLIYRNIKAGLPVELERFRAIQAELLDAGAQVVVLGCTELSLVKRDYAIGPGFLDAMEVLARQAVLCCGMPLKEQYRHLITC